METLTLGNLSSIAEILGVVLIVISLIYVAAQIRQNTLAIQTDTAQAVHNEWGAVYGRISGDSELSSILLKGSNSLDGLSDVEKSQFMTFWIQTMLTFQNAYYQSESGSLDIRLWQPMETTMFNIHLTSAGYQEFWQERRMMLSSDFREYVEQKIVNTQATPGYKAFGVKDLMVK